MLHRNKKSGILLLLLAAALLSVSFIPPEQVRPGKDKAYIFAVNDYSPAIGKLGGTPINDAKEIKYLLETYYGFEVEIFEDPTKNEIRGKILSLQSQRFTADEQLLFFFTGHGKFDQKGDEEDRGIGYFLPADARKPDRFRDSYIGYSYLVREINAIPCQHILLLVDACYSGALLKYKTDDDERPGKLSERQRLIRNALRHKSRLAITAGGLERTSSGTRHSPFEQKLASALKSRGGEDGVLTYLELFSQMRGISPAPRRGYFGDNHIDGDFVFIASIVDVPDYQEDPNVTTLAKDLEAWRTAQRKHSIRDYKAYMDEFPQGQFWQKAYEAWEELVEEAKGREENTYWAIAEAKDNEEAYKQYLSRYPNGRYAAKARARVDASTFVKVPSGTFTMGCESAERDGGCDEDESPAHEVTVSTFYMSVHEVTNAQFATFLNAEGNQEEGGTTWYEIGSSYAKIKEISGGKFKVEEGFERHPVVEISWYAAVAYAAWLSKKTGQNYRLPTEAEWEYAARGGEVGAKDKFLYSGSDDIDAVAWHYGNSSQRTHEVGQKQPNQLGLYDMSGNVWEWVADCWHEDYKVAPKDGSAWLKSKGGDCRRRVLRGGSWYNNARHSRVAIRNWSNTDVRYYIIGFRLARD